MVQIIVGPFTHHDAVEAFGVKFGILEGGEEEGNV